MENAKRIKGLASLNVTPKREVQSENRNSMCVCFSQLSRTPLIFSSHFSPFSRTFLSQCLCIFLRCTHECAWPPGEDSAAGHTQSQLDMAKPVKRAKEYPFTLDSFQQIATKSIDIGQSVLVSAHTSAGKTACAEYAIAKSLRDGQRVVYTCPIKALSNQKYRDLYEEFQVSLHAILQLRVLYRSSLTDDCL